MQNLKIALLRSGRRQYEIAAKSGISETRLSRIVTGRALPSPDEIERIASALECRPEELGRFWDVATSDAHTDGKDAPASGRPGVRGIDDEDDTESNEEDEP